jgi:hypothetical protein
VDSLGNFQDAVNMAKRMAHIKGEAKLVYPKRKRRSLLWNLLFRDMIDYMIDRIDRRCGIFEYRWNGEFSVSD